VSYYNLNGKEFELRNVCAKSLKVCKELGLLQKGERITKEEQDLILEALATQEDGLIWKAQQIFERKPIIDEMEIYLDPEKLTRLIEVVFFVTQPELKELSEKWDEINIETVIQATFEFLGKCQPSSIRSGELLKTLTNLIPKTA
jgi:hypothetical protein